MQAIPDCDMDPGPNSPSHPPPKAGPRVVVFLGTWRTFSRSPGMWQEEEAGQSDLPSFPKEMSNPLSGSDASPSEEVALSGDRPRALHNKQPPPAPLHSGHGRIWGLAKTSDEHLYPV